MKNKSHDLNGESGVSVIETLVVVVIIAIVASLAYMKMNTANPQFQRQNFARELKVAFERARFDSVKRRGEGPNPAGTPEPAKVEVNAGSFTLYTDENRDGTYETQPTALANGVVIAGYGSMTFPFTVYFDKRGEVTTPGGVAPQFLVCNASCSSPNSATANIVLVTPAGTVNLLPGGVSLPTFGVPSSTTVSTSTGINPDAILP